MLLFLIQNVCCSEKYSVDLSHDGPIVLGATIHFNAFLSYSYGSVPIGRKFRYTWRDNSLQQNHAQMILASAACSWNITYSAKLYPPGPYVVEVEVDEDVWWGWSTVTSQRVRFEVTSMLNGELKMTQGTQVQTGRYIASDLPVRNEAILTSPDFKFINDTATNITTMWFVDCVFVGNSSGFEFKNNYSKPDETHEVSAIVIAGFEPKPTPPPPTTTTPAPPPTTTTTPAPTTTTSTTTTVKPTTTSTTIKPKLTMNRVKRETKNLRGSFLCNNKSLIEPHPNITYGFFNRRFTIKAPIKNVTISGNNWLQRGDILNLRVNCKGSEPIRYCLIFKNGVHNATGNETCDDPPSPLESCEFNITHLFRDEKEHSIFIVLLNDVTKIVKTAGVQFYQSIHHPQLSVIVVPVVFSLIAVVLIVFGAAYYFQSSHRFIVEVADFDFGQQFTEMEYKTFYQRLRESIMASLVGTFFVGDDYPEDDEALPPSNQAVITPTTNGFKYGSM